MHRSRLAAAFVALLAVPALASCGGGDSAHEYGPVTDQSGLGGERSEASAAPSADSPSEGVDLERGTVEKSALSAVQADLYEDVLLFEEAAKAEAEAEDGFGARTGSFGDEDGDFTRARPEGMRAATAYALSWAEGKITSYTLSTEDGDELTWEGGRILVAHEVDTLEDSVLAHEGAALSDAIDAWVDEHEDFPSLNSTFGTVTLAVSMFDESEAETVEVELSDSVNFDGYLRSGDEFHVDLSSRETDERLRIDEDGVTFTRSLEVV